MKYLEEINSGDCFIYQTNGFVLTTDFKKNGTKSVVCLSDGTSQWLKSDTIIEPIDIFTLDKDSNIIAFKKREKSDATTQNTNIS